MRVAYFTAAVTGAGHLVRGIAIGRGLRRAGFDGEYRMFGPRLDFAIADRPDYEVVPIDQRALAPRQRAEMSALALSLVRFAPDLLIVDMFWPPLRHILPLRGCEAWLITRRCAPVWFEGPPGFPFAARQYRRIVAIEPFEHDAVGERIDPIVICNPDECRPPGSLRARLGVAPGQRLVAVVHAGIAGEREALVAEPGAEPPHVFDLFDAEALFPIAEWLGDADLVLSGAGYNSYWEARWLGYEPRTRFKAFPRKMDDQGWRLASCGAVRPRENGADTLARAIVGG